jgi:hypothetical protein
MILNLLASESSVLCTLLRPGLKCPPITLYVVTTDHCMITLLTLFDPMLDLVRHYDFPVPDAFLDL